MQVYLTVDVELWPNSWNGYRTQFTDCFRRYILGETSAGRYGLQFQLDMLKEYDLKGVFFVESLFACEFGISPLQEILSMILDAGQEVQVHAHPEWVVHMPEPFVEPHGRYTLGQFNRAEQHQLISEARNNIVAAGVASPTAFRSGSFSADKNTLLAATDNGFTIDSSLNPVRAACREEFGLLQEPALLGEILEFPLTIYEDWPGHRRHLQVAATSFGEFQGLLEVARNNGAEHIVMLSHSAELLDAKRRRCDHIAVRRFEKMCEHLALNRDKYATSHFGSVPNDLRPTTNIPLAQVQWNAVVGRIAQQSLRRIFY